jgi:lauroyl/myristoyl acyltransferase
MRYRINKIRQDIADVGRALAMLLLLRPAADWLPASWALALAELIGFVIAVSPTRGRATYSTMCEAFGLSGLRAARAAQQWLARPFRDFVVLRRIARGREDCSRWKVREIGNEAVRRLKESGQPFIVATGHFARESFLALFLPAVLPYRIGVVAAPPEPPSRDPFIFRLRVQYGQLLEALEHVRLNDLSLIFTGGVVSRLDRRLRQPGNAVVISVDAYWNGGGAYVSRTAPPVHQGATGLYTRPFIGQLGYRVATGAAALSRIAQCPIVPCVIFMEDDGTRVIEWGMPVPAPAPHDADADVRITNSLLRSIERAVGGRPAQYVLPIGASRRWNALNEKWEEPLSKAS